MDKSPVGKQITIRQVGGEPDLRTRLLDMGLIPSAVVEVRQIAPLGDPIVLWLWDYALSIRKEDAARITVEVAGR